MDAIPSSESTRPSRARATVHAFSSKRDSPGRTGTGRALIEALEAAARSMGFKRQIADSLTSSVEMRGLFPKLGFVELDAPIETTSYKDQPMLRPHLHYFSKDL